ncbi:MAG: archaeosortase/exosortase family protein [Candidatus Diapherotrites archaeon]|nr:archaeosortase/exosortase family protein [Candidatus Diapherotrites archaeon]
MVSMKEFLGKFFLVFSILYLFFHAVDLFFGLLLPLRQFVAVSSFMLLAMLSLPVSLSGLTITLGGSSFTIITSCTGVVSFSIFAGLLYATPMKKEKRKLTYITAFFPLAILWNVFRVTATLSLGGELIEVLHNTFWMLSVLLVLGIYLLILKLDGTTIKKRTRK